MFGIFESLVRGIYKGARIILFGNFYYCNYIPSCSEYALDVVKKENFIKAIFLITKRLISCNFFVSKFIKPS